MEGLPGDRFRRPRCRARRRPHRGRSLTARRLVLLRHGRTADNASGRIQGSLDTPLDELGRAQAAAAAELLEPDLLLTSDLQRATATAAAIERRTGLVATHDARLRELHLGGWQGLTSAEAERAFPAEHAAWRRGEDVARGGGETYRQAGERAVACLSDHLDAVPEAGTLLAVTHGGTARAALGLLLDLPAASWWRLVPLGNACWSVLSEAEGGWRLERHGARAPGL